jgi:hypothetical protein
MTDVLSCLLDDHIRTCLFLNFIFHRCWSRMLLVKIVILNEADAMTNDAQNALGRILRIMSGSF